MALQPILLAKSVGVGDKFQNRHLELLAWNRTKCHPQKSDCMGMLNPNWRSCNLVHFMRKTPFADSSVSKCDINLSREIGRDMAHGYPGVQNQHKAFRTPAPLQLEVQSPKVLIVKGHHVHNICVAISTAAVDLCVFPPSKSGSPIIDPNLIVEHSGPEDSQIRFQPKSEDFVASDSFIVRPQTPPLAKFNPKNQNAARPVNVKCEKLPRSQVPCFLLRMDKPLHARGPYFINTGQPRTPPHPQAETRS
ncbi:hypothetical protein DFH06DRAFT_1130790 [Mycena polygramma]|nr:hypothetical protein DFH06DRAFT_1130790 [Mycena polygramma]